MMKKADRKRKPGGGGGPMPPLDPVMKTKVNKWADRAVQAKGLDNKGLLDQIRYYQDKAERARMQGDVSKASKADDKKESWREMTLHHKGQSADLITPMLEQAQWKIEDHRQALRNLDSDDMLVDWKKARESRKVGKWQSKERALKGSLEDSANWADEYHQRRINAAWYENHYHKEQKSQKEAWRSGESADREADNRINKEKATSGWMKWRAIAGKQQREVVYL
jgi:hypothetical protein